MRRWVADTSPLIFLAKLDRLNLLERGADEILVPPTVLQEVRARRDGLSEMLARCSWLREQTPRDRDLVDVLQVELDAGEAEVIALAREARAERVILDDLDARRFARRVGLEMVGTLGLLLAAKLRGELPDLRAEIERLRRSGFRASTALVDAVLKEAGEE